MWLPAPIYERLPILWIVLGLLFIAGGLYIGLEFSPALGYVTVGLACFFAGVAVTGLRLKYRSDRAAASESDEDDARLSH
jgi:hypothetical protein